MRDRDATIEALTRANRELDAFAASAAHDLKAPLRDIARLSQWIAEDAGDALPPSAAEHLALLRARAARAERLVEDLLAYARAGDVSRVAEELPLGAAIDEAARDVAPPGGFTVRVEGGDRRINTPRAALVQVLRNLLANAVRHHDRAQGVVTVRVRDAAEGWILVEVEDDGPGIDPVHHARVFAPFETLRARDHGAGSRLGLAIVTRLVRAFGGEVSLRSMPGEGATFAFTWPARVTETR